MKTIGRMTTCGVIATLLSLSGCIIGGGRDHGYGQDQHRYGQEQHGDAVQRDDHRCDSAGHDAEHCSR